MEITRTAPCLGFRDTGLLLPIRGYNLSSQVVPSWHTPEPTHRMQHSTTTFHNNLHHPSAPPMQQAPVPPTHSLTSASHLLLLHRVMLATNRVRPMATKDVNNTHLRPIRSYRFTGSHPLIGSYRLLVGTHSWTSIGSIGSHRLIGSRRLIGSGRLNGSSMTGSSLVAGGQCSHLQT